MKTSELIEILRESMALNGDLNVSVIFNGYVDDCPTVNAVGETFYIEGVKEA